MACVSRLSITEKVILSLSLGLNYLLNEKNWPRNIFLSLNFFLSNLKILGFLSILASS